MRVPGACPPRLALCLALATPSLLSGPDAPIAFVGGDADVGVGFVHVTKDPGHGIGVRLTGTRSNRDGLGATVEVTTDGGPTQMAMVNTTGSYVPKPVAFTARTARLG